jgi:MFS family permease
MAAQIVRFFSLLFVGLALAPALAHVLQLPHKMDLSGEDYLRVQQLYAGWAWLGVLVLGALISTFLLTVLVRTRLRQFVLACIALGSVFVTQVIFWIFTFPVNQQTHNWTVLPVNWMTLRERWEYSHATSAFFDLIAFIAVVLAVLAAVGHPEDEPMRWTPRTEPTEGVVGRALARRQQQPRA